MGIALKPVLIHEGVYRESCTEEELQKDVRVCYQQELKLNFMFTAAAVATNVSEDTRCDVDGCGVGIEDTRCDVYGCGVGIVLTGG